MKEDIDFAELNSQLQRLMDLAYMVARDKKTKVVLGRFWYYDSKKDVISVAPLISVSDYDKAKAVLVHEIGHKKFTNSAAWKRALGPEGKYENNKLFKNCLNAVEDVFVENRMVEIYGGFNTFMKAACNEINKRYAEKPDDVHPFAQRVMAVYDIARGYNCPFSDVPDYVKDIADKANALRRSGDATTVALAEELYKAIKEEFKEQLKKASAGGDGWVPEEEVERDADHAPDETPQPTGDGESDDDEGGEEEVEAAESEGGEGDAEADAEEDEGGEETEAETAEADAEEDETETAEGETEEGEDGSGAEEGEGEDGEGEGSEDGTDGEGTEPDEDEGTEGGEGDEEDDAEMDAEDDWDGEGDEGDEDDADAEPTEDEGGEDSEERSPYHGDPDADPDADSDDDAEAAFDSENSTFAGTPDMTKEISDDLDSRIDEDLLGQLQLIRPPLWIDAADIEANPLQFGKDFYLRYLRNVRAKAAKKWYDRLGEDTRKLYMKLQNVLLEASQIERLRGMPQGKIHGGSLHRIRHGEYNVFSKKIKGMDATQIAVAIMVDCSGSMYANDKAVVARDTAVVIGDTLHRCGVQFGVFGYTSLEVGKNGDYPANIEFKNFIASWTGRKDLLRHLGAYRNNYDAASILDVYKKLLAVNAKRRILIVISDGYPCPEDSEYLKNLVPVMMQGVDVVGIGLDFTNVAKFYPQNVLCDVKDLAEKLAPVLQSLMLDKRVRRGGRDIALTATPATTIAP